MTNCTYVGTISPTTYSFAGDNPLSGQGTGDEIMNVGPKTHDEEGRAICKSKKCRHLLSRQFIDYNWVTGRCPNPDCFYHSHPQEDVEDKKA